MAVAVSQELANDIRRLVSALEQLHSQSRFSADSVGILEDALKRLKASGEKPYFASVGEEFSKLAGAMRLTGAEARFSKREMDSLLETVGKLREMNLRDYGITMPKAVGMDELVERLGRAAFKAGITRTEINALKKDIRDLGKAEDASPNIVRSLTRIGKSANFTDDQIKKLHATARRWRTEFEKGVRAGIKAAETFERVGERGRRVTPVSGVTADEQTIGQRIALEREYYEKTLPGGVRALGAVDKALGKAEMSLGNLTDVTQDSARGIIRWTATVDKGDKIIRRTVITTDRYGQVLKSTQRHLRTFTGGIARDITEVMKWAVAVAVVYAPLRRLTQLMEEAVQIEAKLADVQVALGNTTTSLTQVWKESTIIARELGVTAEGVVDGYVLAARATANIQEPTARAAATVAVLRDSMILAKLAGLDQAIAMDTLVGALRQLGRPLTEGTELLDKWVAVSKAANVSIATLAESFAITSTAAQNVGVDIDYLNGIIAAVAEVTTLSATESGNAVRAFISGFQRDNSERELAKFGIAVKNVNGELRFFTEVMDDIIQRKGLGLISDAELAKLAEIIGGGVRRGPQITAILENYSRVQELATISSNASGDAAEAVAIKMDTLQSATVNLNNAFTELAKALGTEGGFLDSAKSGVETLTTLVDIFTKIVQVLGKATPAIIAMSAALILLRRNARIGLFLDQEILGTMVGGRGLIGEARLQAGLGAERLGARTGTTFRGAGTRIFGAGGGAVGGAAIGLGMAALSGNINRENAERAGGQIAGGILGALMTGGSPVGALIGSTIVDAIYGGVLEREADLESLFTSILSGAFFEAGKQIPVEELAPEEATKELTKLIGTFGSEFVGSLRVRFAKLAFDLQKGENLPTGEKGFEAALLTIAAARAGMETGPGADLISIVLGLEGLTPEKKARIIEIVNQMRDAAFEAARDVERIDPNAAYGLRLLGISENLGPMAAAVLREEKSRLLQEVSRGEVGVRALTEFLNIGNFEQVVSTVYAAIDTLGNSTIKYNDLANILINVTEQERQIFIQYADEIADLDEAYRKLGDSTEDYAVRQERARLGAERFIAVQQYQQILEATAAGRRFREFEVPSVIGVAEEATAEQIRQAIATTRRLQEERVKALSPDPELREKAEQSWEDIIVQIGDTINSAYTGMFTDIDTGIFADILREMGLEAQDVTLGILTPDLPSAQAPQLRGNIQFFQDIIKQLRPLDIEKIGIIFSDYVTDILHADNLAVQLALATLIDVNEQQLEGIFNIPEGVTAQIPFTGRLFFSDQPIPTAGGMGNILEALGPALDQLPRAVEEVGSGAHTDALAQIALLNQMLATGITSDDLAAVIENAIRERGGEPVERGTGPDPVQWGQEVGEQIAAIMSQEVRAFIMENPELKTFPIDQIEELLRRVVEPPETGDAEIRPEDFMFDTTSFDALFRDIQTWINQPVDLSGLFGGISDFFKENFSVQAAEAAGLEGSLLTQNPELRGILGANALSPQDILNAMPQSIPVTINTRITNPVTVLVDGRLIQRVIEERSYTDLEQATRRVGALGYVME